MKAESPGQTSDSVALNREFFASGTYLGHAERLDSHRAIRDALTRQLVGTRRLLDVGNGGVLEYDPAVIENIVAVDLFLDDKTAGLPVNCTPRRGDALALSEEPGSFDVVLAAFLFHHLTGRRPADSIMNVRRALTEAIRMLAPGGRLVIAESCIPTALFPVERALFRPLRAIASTRLLGGHPATLQLPIGLLKSLVAEQIEIERCEEIPLGRWVTQFGRRWPVALTPVRAYLIVARTPATPGSFTSA